MRSILDFNGSREEGANDASFLGLKPDDGRHDASLDARLRHGRPESKFLVGFGGERERTGEVEADERTERERK